MICGARGPKILKDSLTRLVGKCYPEIQKADFKVPLSHLKSFTKNNYFQRKYEAKLSKFSILTVLGDRKPV